MGFLDDLTSLLGGGSQPTGSGYGAAPNYGAMPAPQPAAPAAAPAPSLGNVLARLRPPASAAAPPGPLGIGPTVGGGNVAAALAGLSRVDPHASRFGAFAQGLAGGMASQLDAQSRDQQLRTVQNSAQLQQLKEAIEIQQLRRNQAGADAAAAVLRGGDGAAPMSPPSPASGGSGVPGGGGGGAAPPMTLAGTAPSPAMSPGGAPAAPAPAIPAGSAPAAPAPDIPPWASPTTIMARAQRFQNAGEEALRAGNQQLATTLFQRAATEQQRATSLMHDHETMDSRGNVVPLPGSIASATQREAAIAGARTQAEANVKDQHELVEAQPTPGGPTVRVPKAQALAAAQGQGAPGTGAPQSNNGGGIGSPPGGALPQGVNIAKQPEFVNQRIDAMWKDHQAMTDQYHARQDAVGRLEQMQQILAKYETGAFADRKAEALAALKATTGINLDQDSVNNFQEFQKLATKNVFNDVKALGGRILVSEIEGLTRANANPNLQPGANQAILGSAIGALKREDAYYGAFTKWHNENPYAYDSSGFEQNWNKANPAIQYAEQGIKDTPAKGIALPAKDKLVDGQSYVTARGPARWNAREGHFEAMGPP